MREILFRGKGVSTILPSINSEWFEGSFIDTRPTPPYLPQILVKGDLADDDYHMYRVDPDTVGQFTGLLDKNGNKIFEGDIVRCHGVFRSVIYDAEYAEFEFDSNDNVKYPESLSLCCDHDKCEVIGNVYDNPELLEVKD